MLLGAVLLIAAVVVTLIVWGQLGATNAPPVGSTIITTSTLNSADTTTQDAAIRDTLMRYNAAETEMAALLRKAHSPHAGRRSWPSASDAMHRIARSWFAGRLAKLR